MKTTKLILFFLLMLIFSTGCSSGIPVPSIQFPTTKAHEQKLTPSFTLLPNSTEDVNEKKVIPTLSATIRATQTTRPTRTSTASLLPTSTTQIDPAVFEYQSGNILAALPAGLEIDSGILVVEEDHTLQVMNSLMEIDKRIDFPAEGLIRISPDQKYLAYSSRQENQNSIVILDVNGDQVRKISIEEVVSDFNWLNNESVILDFWGKPDDQLDVLTVINIQTGERKQLSPDYPEIYFGNILSQWGFYTSSETVYDPTLTRVIYPAERGKFALALWDLVHNRLVVDFEKWSWGKTAPLWSPSGDRAVVLVDAKINTEEDHIFDREPFFYSYDFFAIQRDGAIERLTYLSDYFFSVNIYDFFSWSPDGRYLAFWMSLSPDDPHNVNDYIELPYKDLHFAVLDTNTGKIVSFGNLGDKWLNKPIWSPDGMQILVNSGAEERQNNRGFLIDLASNQVIQIVKGAYLVGWLAIP
jgi:hypothetical protein